MACCGGKAGVVPTVVGRGTRYILRADDGSCVEPNPDGSCVQHEFQLLARRALLQSGRTGTVVPVLLD